MGPSSPQFDPNRDFRDQLKEIFSHDNIRLFFSFRIRDQIAISVQASKAHHCVPQQNFKDPYMYSAWEVVVFKSAKPMMQVQYIDTEYVQRLLTDAVTDFGRLDLSPLRPIENDE